MSHQVTPTPTIEEAVIIAAAIEAMWPRPVVGQDPIVARQNAWRFSGRWWARPGVARRDRP
jgi:hypothetical protein